MEKINYIPDSAINLIENDILGTSVYVELLEKTIQNCPTPYTIGLFGSRGVGKSSIIKTLQEKNKDNKNVFIYDAWKYSKDDFRRSFLLEFSEYFRLDIEELKNRLYTNIVTNWSIGISKIFNIQKSRTKTYERIIQPEVFEKEFEKAIKRVVKGNCNFLYNNKYNKVIIAVDNIDRCHKEQVLEILLTIKNFLEKPNTVFIIPLDDSGLRSYLQMPHQDANEFIRKIFNSTIHIKSFSDSQLYDFGIQLCKKYKINFPKKENVISIITQEFTRNPRKIIQFLNILQTELYLAKLQEDKGLIPHGAITDNIEMFVKILILRDEYPELYQKIKDDKSILEEINQHINNNEFTLDENGNYVKDKIQLSLLEYRFLSRTLHINIDRNLMDSLFVVKDTYKDIPDEIYSDVISQNWERIKQIIQKNKLTIQKLLEYINKLIDEDVIKRNLYDTSGFNLISLTFKIIAEKNMEIYSLPKNILSVLNSNQIWKHLFNFPPAELVSSIKWLNNNQKCNFCSKLINGINDLDSKSINENQINLINNFLSEFDGKIISKIKDKFSQILSNNFVLYNKFKKIIKSDKAKYLLTYDFIKSLIPQLNQNYTQNQTKEKVEIIRALKEYNILKDDTVKEYINKCIQNAGTLQQYNNPDLFAFWLEAMLDFIEIINDDNSVNSIYNLIINNWGFIYHQFNSRNLNQDYIKTYKSYSSVIGKLYINTAINNDQNRINDLSSKLNSFFNFQVHHEIAKHVNSVYKDIIEKTNRVDFLPSLISQFISQNDIKIKEEIFKTLEVIIEKMNIDLSPYRQDISKLISHVFSLSQEENKEKWLSSFAENSTCQEEIIKLISSVKDRDLEPLIQILSKTNLLENNEFKEVIFNKIREYLAYNDINIQQSGINNLYNLILHNKELVNYKKEVFKSLLNDIDENKIDDDTKGKLRVLKENYK